MGMQETNDIVKVRARRRVLSLAAKGISVFLLIVTVAAVFNFSS